MADILKSFTSNLIRFAAGERPSADKFNAMVSYFSRGMEDISRAIGDVYDVRPEGVLHSAKWNATNGQRRNLDILNLARIIGPASNLNAKMLDHSDSGKSVSETIVLGTKEHELNYELNNNNLFTLNPSSLIEVNSNSFSNENQYYYNRENNSIVFAKPTNEEIRLSYFTNPNEYFGGINYSEAGFNVIPDPNIFISTNANTDDAKLKIEPVTGEDNSYTIQLPKVFAQQSGLANEDGFKDVNLLNTEEYNYQSQIKLPEWMAESLSVGDAIPLNSLYLKDLTLGEGYLTADYFYVSETTIEIKNASLCIGEGHNFVLVTVATDITTSIDDLRLKWFRHTHDGTFGEERINIKNLAGIFVKEHVRFLLPDISFSKSSVEDNHLPMYLHRIGYMTDETVNNGNNSMLGTLLMSRSEFDYQNAANQPVQSKDGLSHSISFGGIGNDGAHIKRDLDSNLFIEGQENPKTGSNIAPNVQISSYNNIDSIAADSIVNTAPNVFEKANYIYDDYEQNKKIRYENGSQELFTNQEYYYQTRESIDNTIGSNTVNDEEHALDYSTTFETTSLFNTKADLTIWKDHSDIQIRKDIENTYTLQPRMLSDTPDYYRPNLNKINQESGQFEWLVYAGEVYKNGDESNKIGCPAIGYKNLNIKEYILPIEDDNFILEYKDEIELDSSNNFNLPWLNNDGNEITANENHEHVISFGELQQLAPSSTNFSEFVLTTQTILRESTQGSTQNVGEYNFLDNDLRIFKYKSNEKRTFNYLDITSLINNNLKTTPYIAEAIDRIQLQTVRNVSQNSTDQYKLQPYGEVVIFERINSIDWNQDTYQAHDYWKFRNGIFTHGYFSFENEENNSNNTPENITTHRKYPKALINENFAIYVKNTSTNKIYWLKPYFITYDDFHMSYEPFNNGTSYKEAPFDFGENTDPYWTKQNYDYTILGNTIRFHIRPNIIGENFNSFITNKDDYTFILVHSFENEQNTHQMHDNYTYIESNSSFSEDNDSSWYTIQQSNNSLYNGDDTDFNYNKQNIVRYTDFAGHIKNAQYSGIPDNANNYWSFISDRNYLVDLKSYSDLEDYSLSDTYGYYPINRYLYSLPYGKECIHRIHNSDSNPIKTRINRWKDYGENSQYITILRKEPDQAERTDNEVTRRFKIKSLNDGKYNKEVIKFNLINFHFRKTIKDEESDIKKTDSNDSHIEWLNIPNFVISYTNVNEFKKRSENDFYFNGYYIDTENDNAYLNTNGNFTKPIFVKINDQYLGKQYKKDINLSVYLKKYIVRNILSLFSYPKFDYSISYPRLFSNENILSSFSNFKKSIFSNAFYHIDHKRKNIINTSFKNKWRLHLYSGTGNHWLDGNNSGVTALVDDMDWVFEMSETLNYVFGLNFILEVKEVTNSDSIKLNITFDITNLNVNKIKTGT